MSDNVRGNTRGRELIYYSDDDKLLVKGADGKPAISHIRKQTRRNEQTGNPGNFQNPIAAAGWWMA